MLYSPTLGRFGGMPGWKSDGKDGKGGKETKGVILSKAKDLAGRLSGQNQ